jgi:ATP synthase F1 delta subunit
MPRAASPKKSVEKVEKTVKIPQLSPAEQAQQIVAELILATDLDLIHLSLINLTDMVDAGEMSLFLNQIDKTAEQKKGFVQAIIKELPSDVLAAYFTKLLASDGPEAFLEQALRPFLAALKAEADHCAIVILTVAEHFRPEDLRDMSKTLSEKIGKHVVLTITVDKHLLGGAIIQYGNYISDYSLRTQLNLYRDSWKQAKVEHE